MQKIAGKQLKNKGSPPENGEKRRERQKFACKSGKILGKIVCFLNLEILHTGLNVL